MKKKAEIFFFFRIGKAISNWLFKQSSNETGNLVEFVKYFKLKVKNFKRIDKGMLISLYNEFKKKVN